MSISLDSAVRTCKIDTGYADRIFSDRFLNPGNMVCPVWNGYDNAGRPVSADSFNTKTQGCQSALDRVAVENYQRPQYVEYVNLSAGGINGQIYGDMYSLNQWDTMYRNEALKEVNNITGSFGQDLGSKVYPGCGSSQYTRAMQQSAQDLRKFSSLDKAQDSAYTKQYAGIA